MDGAEREGNVWRGATTWVVERAQRARRLSRTRRAMGLLERWDLDLSGQLLALLYQGVDSWAVHASLERSMLSMLLSRSRDPEETLAAWLEGVPTDLRHAPWAATGCPSPLADLLHDTLCPPPLRAQTFVVLLERGAPVAPLDTEGLSLVERLATCDLASTPSLGAHQAVGTIAQALAQHHPALFFSRAAQGFLNECRRSGRWPTLCRLERALRLERGLPPGTAKRSAARL